MARHRVLRSRRAGSRRDHSRHGRLRQRRRAVIDRDSGDERARRPTTRRGRAVRRAGRRLDDSESEEDAGFASDESSDAGVQRLASGDSSSSSSSTTAAAASSSIPELDGFDSAVQVPSDPAISSAPAAADDAADDGETAAATSIPALTCAFCGQGSTSAHPLPDMRVGDGHPLIFGKQRVWVHMTARSGARRRTTMKTPSGTTLAPSSCAHAIPSGGLQALGRNDRAERPAAASRSTGRAPSLTDATRHTVMSSVARAQRAHAARLPVRRWTSPSPTDRGSRQRRATTKARSRLRWAIACSTFRRDTSFTCRNFPRRRGRRGIR